ncbi:MAG: hypothetical protein ACI9G1_003707 [Pirellulaceae bacterium]|jgi:hypothetical protein
MSKFPRIVVLLALMGANLFPSFRSALAPASVQAAEIADLQDQLENGLEAKTPAQIAFITLVVSKVDSGQLPLSIVYATFKWARPKEPRAYPYFQEAIRRQARKYNVNL